MRYLLKTYDDGYGFKKITGTRTIDDTEIYDTTKFILVPKNVYDYVNETYPEFELKFPDTISANLMLENIISTAIEGIEGYKNDAQSIYIFKELRNDNVNIDFVMMSIKFMLLNNRFINNGYAFTRENREQLYLQIINENNTQLVSMLDDYLLVLDYILDYESRIDIYLEMKKQLLTANTLEEVRTIYNTVTGRDLLTDLNN